MVTNVHVIPARTVRSCNYRVPRFLLFAAGSYAPVNEVLTQGRVLLQLVTSWWPTEEQGTNHRASSTGGQDTSSAIHAAAVQEGLSDGNDVAAAGEAAAAALPPLWSLTLQQWVTVGLLPQLLAVLSGGSRDTLQQDLEER
jgi:hypothetical protein